MEVGKKSTHFEFLVLEWKKEPSNVSSLVVPKHVCALENPGILNCKMIDFLVPPLKILV